MWAGDFNPDPKEPVTLDCRNLRLELLLDRYGQLADRTLIKTPELQDDATFTIEPGHPLSRAEALKLIDRHLAAAGIRVVPMGTRFMKVVRTDPMAMGPEDGKLQIGESAASGEAMKNLPPPAWNLENIAIADLSTYSVTENEARSLTDALHHTIVETAYFNVLSRAEMQSVLQAQAFQRTEACDDSTCLVEMGKILAVQKMVGGSIGRVGSTFSVTVRMVDVETGKTILSAERDLRSEPDQLLPAVRQVGRDLASKYGDTRRR